MQTTMALCERCGSINVVKVEPSPLDRLIALVTKKRPFLCRRCRWRGRRDWTDKDLERLVSYGAGGAEVDPALSVLDDTKKRRRKLQSPRGHGSRRAISESFGLESPELGKPNVEVDIPFDLGAPPSPRPVSHRRGRRRRSKSRRREIIATVSVTALVMFVVVILTITRSCSGSEAL